MISLQSELKKIWLTKPKSMAFSMKRGFVLSLIIILG